MTNEEPGVRIVRRSLFALVAFTLALHVLAVTRLETAIPDAVERAAVVRVLQLIANGGPFPYRQDGSVFGNREGRLPAQPSGYYHEYTVPTPGAADRGARRVVRGNGGETYYTRDHYATFFRIDEG